MLQAVDSTTEQTIHARRATIGQHYQCPECREAVVLRRGTIVQAHFAHRADSACGLSDGESERHAAMKEAVSILMAAAGLPYSTRVEYEVALIPERRADVVVTVDVPKKPVRFVVECQHSPIAIEDWEARTRAYSEQSIGVLWLWDAARLSEVERHRAQVWRVPAEIDLCHDLSSRTPRNRAVYILTETGAPYAVHLRGVRGRKTLAEATFTPFHMACRVRDGSKGLVMVQPSLGLYSNSVGQPDPTTALLHTYAWDSVEWLRAEANALPMGWEQGALVHQPVLYHQNAAHLGHVRRKVLWRIVATLYTGLTGQAAGQEWEQHYRGWLRTLVARGRPTAEEIGIVLVRLRAGLRMRKADMAVLDDLLPDPLALS